MTKNPLPEGYDNEASPFYVPEELRAHYEAQKPLEKHHNMKATDNALRAYSFDEAWRQLDDTEREAL